MTADSPFDGTLTDETEFESLLGQLLLAALDNDVDPKGSWVFREDGVERHMEVQVTELAPGDDAD